MTNEKKYIYWHPGDEQPEDLSGWEVWVSSLLEFGTRLHLDETLDDFPYRKAVTAEEKRKWLAGKMEETFDGEEERRSFFGMLAWPCECPEGYEVVDFGIGYDCHGDRIVMTGSGGLISSANYPDVTGPILRKIEPCKHVGGTNIHGNCFSCGEHLEPELPEINEETVLTDKMEYGDGNNCWCGVCDSVGVVLKESRLVRMGYLLFRYIDQPDTEYTYTPPIEWVEGKDITDDDACHRVKIKLRDDSGSWLKDDYILVCVLGYDGLKVKKPVAIYVDPELNFSREECWLDDIRMDKREREKYDV